MKPTPKEKPEKAETGRERATQPSLMEIQEKLGLFDQEKRPRVAAQKRRDALEEKPLSFV